MKTRSYPSHVRRNQAGASLIFIGICSALLIALIYCGFQYSMLLGGSRQVRNSVDAAVLNVNTRLVESKVTPQVDYSDCADSSGQIS
ncbi:MAG: hypothetical protein K2Z81_06105, partial [Cyanobacteria bacterium]|nr:hypothetical protein [Cyanobacteriota bacterium]